MFFDFHVQPSSLIDKEPLSDFELPLSLASFVSRVRVCLFLVTLSLRRGYNLQLYISIILCRAMKKIP